MKNTLSQQRIKSKRVNLNFKVKRVNLKIKAKAKVKRVNPRNTKTMYGMNGYRDTLSQQRREKKKRGNILTSAIITLFGILVIVGTVLVAKLETTAYYESDYVEDTATHLLINTTAYSEYDSCHYKGCPTASGVRAYIGGIACPRHWELGTEVLIKGKTYTCEDRYNADLPDRLDVFMGFGQEAYITAKNWGVQPLLVTILNK